MESLDSKVVGNETAKDNLLGSPKMLSMSEANSHGGITAADVLKARGRLIQMHFESQVGHLGGNLSCLDAVMVALHEFVGPNDRFVLSKGHSAGALYIALWAKGVIDDAELKTFHKDGTRLPGHPPTNKFEEIPFATGSLGHGLSLASGMALSRKLRAESSQVFCLTSDGEWQEGSTWEAFVLACHQRLSNMTILIDQNGLQGFGTTKDVASMGVIADRISGFDVDVVQIPGHNLEAIRSALKQQTDRLRVVILETTKGFGVPDFENRLESHYVPITESQMRSALIHLGMQ